MGFFRKLFGGDVEEEADAPPAPTPTPPPPTPPPLEDPYRGPAYVIAEPPAELVIQPNDSPPPIWHYKGRILALEANRTGRLPLRSMVYTGFDDSRLLVVRHVTFGKGGYRLDWEHRTPFPDAYEGYVVRVDDRVVMPLAKGVLAVHVDSGQRCWELPHPAALQMPPRANARGELLLVFRDQSWMIVSHRDGALVREGVAKRDRDITELHEEFVALGRSAGSRVRVSGSELTTERNGIAVTRESAPPPGEEQPQSGHYPVEGDWQCDGWLALASGRVAIDLHRTWSGRRTSAIGLVDAVSLAPVQLLELGETRSTEAWVVDELIAVDTDIVGGTPDDVMFVIDPLSERVIACFREDAAAGWLYDRDGETVWGAAL